MPKQQSAPIYLNLFRIRFPVGAVTSIAHRVAGFLLFLAFPVMVYLLDLSLQGEQGFSATLDLLDAFWLRMASTVIAWSLIHHLLAGIRFLIIDTGAGVELAAARKSALLVNISAILVTLLYCWKVLL